MTVVISCILSGYDTPKSHVEQSVPCDFVMVTDRVHPSWKRSGWRFHAVPPSADPRLGAKNPKVRPWDFAPEGPWVWIDGHIEITSHTFIEDCLAATTTIGQYPHPDRDDITAEAWFSAGLPKYKDQRERLIMQADSYTRQGHPGHWGLWAAGIIVYKEKLAEFGLDWYGENSIWTTQDQVSEPHLLRLHDLRPDPLPGTLRDNPAFRIHRHRDGSS